MISLPVATWIALNTLGCIGALLGDKPNKNVSFGLALGTSMLSCALLSSGALHLFLGMEITLWGLQSFVALLGAAVIPPGAGLKEAGNLAIAASIRLALALIVWLWL
jgi:hypothetical protein